MPEQTFAPGFCACGCGGATTRVKQTDNKQGYVKGQPRRFLPFHHLRVRDQWGENNLGWKGGRVMGGKGYVLIKNPQHPNASKNGYVFEHVLVASQALGKPLPAGALVHHIDEDHANNRNNNLVICRMAYHFILHMRMRALKACGNANYRKCSICKTWDDPEKMRPFSHGHSFFHVQCRKEFDVEWNKERQRRKHAAQSQEVSR